MFCKPSALQINLCKKIIGCSQLSSFINHSVDGSQHLSWINDLKKVCNYPALYTNATEVSYLLCCLIDCGLAQTSVKKQREVVWIKTFIVTASFCDAK